MPLFQSPVKETHPLKAIIEDDSDETDDDNDHVTFDEIPKKVDPAVLNKVNEVYTEKELKDKSSKRSLYKPSVVELRDLKKSLSTIFKKS